MPPKNQTSYSLSIEKDQSEWLKEIAGKYSLPDESKSLRVLLDFAMKDVNPDDIFAPENMRCRHCVV